MIVVAAAAQWNYGSFAERVLWEISSACIDTKPRTVSNKSLGGGQ